MLLYTENKPKLIFKEALSYVDLPIDKFIIIMSYSV